MDEIKKTTIRFNLENEQDKELWNAIQGKPERKKNNYIKFLIWAGLHQEEQKKVLEELSDIKNMLVQGDFQVALCENEKEIVDKKESKEVEQQKEPLERWEKGQQEEIEIDAEVMNFLDNL